MTDTTQETNQLMRDYAVMWNERDISRIPDLISESFVMYDETIPGGEVRGHDGLEEWIHKFTTAFPDFQVEVLDVLSDEKTIMTEQKYTMTHEGEFGEIPPTHQEVELRAMAKFRIEDGEITEHREYHDRQTIFEQLGITEE